MFTTLLYLALIQLAQSLAIPLEQAPSSALAPPTHHLTKRVTTGVKVAVGICVPAAALAVGLGIVILAMYPAQLRKLRAQNNGADVTLADVMNGKVTQRPAPPPYEPNRDSTTTAGDGAREEPPSYLVQPKADTTATTTTTTSEVNGLNGLNGANGPPADAGARQAV